MSCNMTVLDVVTSAVRAAQADGLRNPAADCACLMPDLSPDGCMCEDCMIAYRRDCSVCGNWYMVSSPAHPGGPCPDCQGEPAGDNRHDRFEHRERADYDLERFDQEFKERLYSDKGREILRAWEQRERRTAKREDR